VPIPDRPLWGEQWREADVHSWKLSTAGRGPEADLDNQARYKRNRRAESLAVSGPLRVFDWEQRECETKGDERRERRRACALPWRKGAISTMAIWAPGIQTT
jgi:hypothetical protein